MTFAQTAGLGALAGLTIFLGLPVARMGRPRPSQLAFLTAASVGVLVFLLYDVVKGASETIEGALDESRGTGIWYGILLAAGIAVGALGLVVFERLWRRRKPMPSGPGALAASAVGQPGVEAAQARRLSLSAGARVAVFIAVGIGLHNFSEGLAIGQSAADGAYRLFLVLVIGFGLHNITEGFGITAPLYGERPTWRFLAMLGLIGGGPTFAGSLVGFAAGANQAVSVLFLALAAGAILYVIGELQHAGRKIGAHDVAMVGLLTGFLMAYGTDLVLHVAGA